MNTRMITYENLKPGMVLESEKHQVIILGTPLPKYPERGEVLPVAIAQTDFSQREYGILAYTKNKRTKEGCLRPLDRELLASPNFVRDFREVPDVELATTKIELLEQALRDVSGNYSPCDPCLFNILDFGQVRGDIEKLLNQ